MIRAAAEAARSGSIIVLPRPPVNLFFRFGGAGFLPGRCFLHTFRTLRLYRARATSYTVQQKSEGYSMKYAFTHGKLLDGTKDMQVQEGLCAMRSRRAAA